MVIEIITMLNEVNYFINNVCTCIMFSTVTTPYMSFLHFTTWAAELCCDQVRGRVDEWEGRVEELGG